MSVSILSSFLMGTIVGEIILIYKNNINKKTYTIDRKKINKLAKLDIKNTKYVDVKFKYTKEIQNYINIIKEKLPFVDLTNYYRNIEELVIYEVEKLKKGIVGNYCVSSVIIKILKGEERVLSHEFLHMASSVYSGGFVFSGFSQGTDEYDIGDGLNEGYTSMLDDMYLRKEPGNDYMLPKFFARSIDKIVGHQKMAKMYFEADLYGLIEELSNYCYSDKIYKMLKNIDIIRNKMDEFGKREFSKEEKEELQKNINETLKIIFTCYINKLKKSVLEGNMTVEELLKLITIFARELAGNVTTPENDDSFNLFTQELADEIANLHLQDINDIIYDIESETKKK